MYINDCKQTLVHEMLHIHIGSLYEISISRFMNILPTAILRNNVTYKTSTNISECHCPLLTAAFAKF